MTFLHRPWKSRTNAIRVTTRVTGMSPLRTFRLPSASRTRLTVFCLTGTRSLPRRSKPEKVVIAAHGNSLRALVKYLDDLSEEEVLKLNIPTGIPLVYELDDQLQPIKRYYLGDQEAIAAATAAVASQGKAK